MPLFEWLRSKDTILRVVLELQIYYIKMEKQPSKKAASRQIVWTQEKIKLLKKHFPTKENEGVAKIIGLSVRSIRSKAFILRLKKSERYWTYGQEKFLLNNWEAMTAVEIGEELKKTRWAVINKYREMTGKRKKKSQQ